MKTAEIIESEKLSAEITSRGIENHFSVSSTDYGTSCYFTFYKNSESLDKYIIRISDHSVENSSRIANERHLRAGSIDYIKVANAVELYMFPERFTFIANSQKFTHIVNGVKGTYERK